jgi:hypothetical protein
MSQDDEARGGHWRSDRGRGLHPGGEGGGACADVFLEPGPHRLLGPAAEIEEASRRPPKSWLHDSSAYQKMHMALIPIFCICQDFFCLCMCKLCYQSLLLVVIDLPESLAAQVPKKFIEKMSVM